MTAGNYCHGCDLCGGGVCLVVVGGCLVACGGSVCGDSGGVSTGYGFQRRYAYLTS